MVVGKQVQIAIIELTFLTRFWCTNNDIMNIDFLANLADIWAAIVGTVEFLVLCIIPWFFGLWGLWKKKKKPLMLSGVKNCFEARTRAGLNCLRQTKCPVRRLQVVSTKHLQLPIALRRCHVRQ